MAGLLCAGRSAYADGNLKDCPGGTMHRPLRAAAIAVLGLALIMPFPFAARAQAPVAALTGLVSSAGEAAMEGVLVSATKAGSNITVTVVTGADGRYAFPADRLGPGRYTLAVRAVGYQLDQPVQTEIEIKASEAPDPKLATQDLRLGKAKDLAAQLSNGEWLASIPGSDRQKDQLLNCVGCHTLERIVRSKYDSEGFLTQILPRMQGYVQQSLPIHPQLRPAERLMEEQGEDRIQIYRAAADYLSTINLGAAEQWKYPLKTFDRPKGKATRVVYTEYDLPRPEMAPHDVIVDKDGIAWFSGFGEQSLGRLDPKTGNVTEFTYPKHRQDAPTGSLGLRADAAGNLWLGNMYQATIVKFDPGTKQFQFWTLPAERNIAAAQINMVSPRSAHVDGKVWTQNNGFAGVHRLDLASGAIETWEPFKGSPRGESHNIYDVIPDSANNAWFTDFRQGQIGRIDARTGEVSLFQTPTPRSAPRRGNMDAQDRLWFGEYRGDRIGMLDTKTRTFKEWKLATRWSAPYDVVLDRNEDAWTGSMVTDQVTRLNTATGEMVDYLLPRSTNIRRVFVDSSTTPVSFWVGSNDGASIVKVEPLD
jgi:virginiamycin B lyase